LKKAAQKLLLCWAWGGVGDNAPGPAYQSFFATFCSQKAAFPLLACRLLAARKKAAYGVKK
jgi:hypothetical protein